MANSESKLPLIRANESERSLCKSSTAKALYARLRHRDAARPKTGVQGAVTRACR